MANIVVPEIDEYAKSKTDVVPDLLQELERVTYERMPSPGMLTGRLEGRFLKMMVVLTGAKRILEVGMFTGYSALSMAEGLPDDGELITLEINDKAVEFARPYFERSPHGKKIKVVHGPALESIGNLDGKFDLVFIDADKVNYPNYYKAVLPLVRSGGVILADNVLWSGRVLNPSSDDDKAIVAFNDLVFNDKDADGVLLTVRDGLFLIRKK